MVGGVEGNCQQFTEAVETCDASLGQLGVRDIIIGEGVSDVNGGDVNVVAKTEE
jgi:hypothetical protein